MNLFHQRGYDGVGVAELSQAIGIAAPSLYSAFGSKRSLFERVLQFYVQANGVWLPAALAAEDRLEDAITYLFVRAAETYTKNPECPGCLVIDGTRNCGDAEAQALTAGFRQATRQLICDRITAGAPDLSDAAVNALSDYAITILVGLSGSARDGMAAEALRTTAEIAATGFIQRLRHYRHQTDQSQEG
ncbi:MAG: TetR/AcrR family transcriptional regulator [Thermosynechococcaceae cyanobacterium]